MSSHEKRLLPKERSRKTDSQKQRIKLVNFDKRFKRNLKQSLQKMRQISTYFKAPTKNRRVDSSSGQNNSC